MLIIKSKTRKGPDVESLRLGIGSVIVLIIYAAIAISLAGCETTEGFGRDMQNLGNNIEDAAEENDVE